jgi:Xaa-Pro aminopeptidase
MQHFFSADFFRQNRAKLRDVCSDTSLIIVTANGLLQRTSDSTYGYAQDSSFWYLTGIEQPDMILVMDGKKEYLLVPDLSVYQSIFDGVADIAELQKQSGIADIVASEAGWSRIALALQKDATVGTPQAMPAYVDVYGMYTNPARQNLAHKIRQHNDAARFIDIRPELARLRCHKQPAELQALQTAIDSTVAGIQTVTERLAEYKYEYEIEAELSKAFRVRGAAGHAFTPIVAGGSRACVLHNVGNNAPLAPDELIVMDVGAEVSHYAADISRTVIYGQPSPRQQAVFDAVLAVQEYALELLKPGVHLKDYEKQVETFMGAQLVKLKLITAKQSREAANIRRYFPHATSHFLGLDVHDVGDAGGALEPGMVLTCEPGIYIPEESIGVRIEDDVLITKTGNKVLTAALPRVLK